MIASCDDASPLPSPIVIRPTPGQAWTIPARIDWVEKGKNPREEKASTTLFLANGQRSSRLLHWCDRDY